jgi:hypothetical protein
VFSFSLTSRNLIISSFISSVTHWSLSNVLYRFQLFAYFLLFSLMSSSFNALWSDRMQGVISVFLYLLGLALCLSCDQFWRKFHGLLRRMYIVWIVYEIFYRHQLGSFDLCCDLVLDFLYGFFFCLDDLFSGYRGILKSPTTTVVESICACKSFKVCLMKLRALTLGA